MRLLNEYDVLLEGILLKPNMCLPGEAKKYGLPPPGQDTPAGPQAGAVAAGDLRCRQRGAGCSQPHLRCSSALPSQQDQQGADGIVS